MTYYSRSTLVDAFFIRKIDDHKEDKNGKYY